MSILIFPNGKCLSNMLVLYVTHIQLNEPYLLTHSEFNKDVKKGK